MRECFVSTIDIRGQVAFSTSPANAQTTANGPYYATPSWDQTLACATTANCPRFIVLSNMSSAAVLDRETGLVWERSPTAPPTVPYTFTWVDAQSHCNKLIVGKRKGWRLPTLQELSSLVDPDQASLTVPNLAIPPGHPFSNVLGYDYWTATTIASDIRLAHIIQIQPNGAMNQEVKTSNAYAWCVRGGPGVDPQ